MIKINLLPTKESRKKGAGQQQLVIFALLLVGLVVILVGIHRMGTSQIDALKQDVKDKQEEIKRLDSIIGEVQTFKTKKADLEKKLEIISQLRKNRRGPVRILDEMSILIPNKVWLTSVSQAGMTMSLNGMATNNKEVADFMKKLEDSEYFGAVQLKKLVRVKERGKEAGIPVQDFTISLTVEKL